MSVKPNTLSMAQSALYNHALAFSPYWGDAEQSDEGTVHFSRLPDGLENLQIKPGFNKRWMGGTCAMNIVFSHNTAHSYQGKIVFKGARGGTFTGKTSGDFCARLLSALDTDNELKKMLLTVDLDSLSIDVKDGAVECTLTPYGGGMAYLIIPPIRTAIPLPSEQVLPLTKAIKAISNHIGQS
ncbi:DUF3156 family protein [Vibrio celticus]|uniref:Uncharacterized protein n=1 Tax=Vibrio celticus TaxID=446372 RepID=A0A1C3JIS6_9VIBR|nr:DUF3156 family protein [Vibrio celticus]SBT14999.1 hypothetical protein VCE7224_03782 [Vibrio celticus]